MTSELIDGFFENSMQVEFKECSVLPKVSVLHRFMSQWAKVERSSNIFRQMQQYYPPHFPLEVRYFLCEWIEEQQWDEIDEINPEHAKQVLDIMLDLLRQKAESQEHFIVRIKLEEIYQNLQNYIETNALGMVQVIKNCLAAEIKFIEQAEQAMQQQQIQKALSEHHRINDLIMNEIQNLTRRLQSSENDVKNLQHKQEMCIIEYNKMQKCAGLLQQLSNMPNSQEKINKEAQLKQQKEQIDDKLTKMAQEILRHRIELSKKFEQTMFKLQEIQKEILDNQLVAWKRQQQLSGNGLVLDSVSIETIQNWVENLAELIWQNRQQIKKCSQLQQHLHIMFPEGTEDMLPKLNDAITRILSSLVTSTFIIEVQPPQVLKKDARFGAVLRFLVGKTLNIHMNLPQVKATIISENQAKESMSNGVKTNNNTSGDILNNTGTMEYQPTTGQLGISFRNMQLKKIKRADKKGTEAVTEEKFCILFQSEFSVGSNELVFQVWTLSLPVVVTVHGNQECNATATVFWDNAFAEAGRDPFFVPDQVEWSRLSEQLNLKCIACTGTSLSQTNLAYLATKLFGNKDPNTSLVSWAQFNKDLLPNTTFTFWEWFFAIIKLIKDNLKDFWNDDAIVGFVSKNQAQDWLSKKPVGTFLLRFSDSQLGGITIAYTGLKQEVLNLAPFTSKDFHIRGLADRLKDLDNLVYLYPNKPKDDVFSKNYTLTDEGTTKNGYIPSLIKITLPNGFHHTAESENKQPCSPDVIYESTENSLQNMEELPLSPNMNQELDTDFPNMMADLLLSSIMSS
ncbi:signal transducer and activator of transcription 5A-like isoform X1 [Biomphalaria glabrata]|uniref:Signal transducer and activator of transcription n=2 Tax=Biomphalaria glabrata TaxID=6526 RepID=A0A9W3BPR8_BIOGL|nr:signal transducer and activator of transcription 5A-like isoform X1 [Biomphalaria glabrata]